MGKKIKDYSAGLDGGGTKKDFSRGLDYRSGGGGGRGGRRKPITGDIHDLLSPNMRSGDYASVWNTEYPHKGHTDATLYHKGSDERIREVDKEHLPDK